MSITINQYGFTYALNRVPSLTDVNLVVNPGEMLVICGASGSGKSTLLRCLKKAVTPAGVQTGQLTGLPSDSEIAIVFQNPETQLVTSSVLHDLAFQMENRGMDAWSMKKHMSEIVGFFGLEELLHKSPHILSGGQKQLVALCAALMCHPQLLLLDEPMSQLDPLACVAFMETIRKINEDLGITIIMAEHRLDDCVSIVDRIAFMEDGHISYIGSARETLNYLFDRKLTTYIPRLPLASMYIDGQVALTPRAFKAGYSRAVRTLPKKANTQKGHTNPRIAVRLTDVTVRYPDAGGTVLNRLNLSCAQGEIVCILGGNGSGKTTLLKVLAGLIQPIMGRVKREAKQIGYMPQHIRHYFVHDRIRDEIMENENTQMLAEQLGLTSLMDQHPFDLSGGEQQKAVLLAVLSRRPNLILLDEPTKGMDPSDKRELASLLRKTGATVIISTHDMEYAARWADRCAMLFDGEIAYEGDPHSFFAGSRYYTTAIHKGLRHIDENAVTLQDVFTLWDISPSSLPPE